MKRAAFFLFAILSFYIAGLYRYPPLLVLSTAALFSLPLLFLLPRHLKKRLFVEPVRRSETAQKEEGLVCSIRVRNTGRLPVSRFGLYVSAWYGDGQTARKTPRTPGAEQKTLWIPGVARKEPVVSETARKASEADASVRPQKYRMVLYGGCDSGERILRFLISAAHCGLMRISLDRLRVYDYLSLFSAKRKLREEITAAVFPAPAELRLVFSSAKTGYGEPETVRASAFLDESRDEVRQLREYRPGDLGRDIHWNQSARTGALWVREYERETQETAEIYLLPERPVREKRGLRRKQREEARLERLDAFYFLLSALIRGLLKQEIRIRVYWRGKKSGRFPRDGRGFRIRNSEDCRQLFLLFYQEGLPFAEQMGEEQRSGYLQRSADPLEEAGREGFCLNPDLELYWNGRLIHCFSQQRLEQEMKELTFVL